jgi:hypothetical protein
MQSQLDVLLQQIALLQQQLQTQQRTQETVQNLQSQVTQQTQTIQQQQQTLQQIQQNTASQIASAPIIPEIKKELKVFVGGTYYSPIRGTYYDLHARYTENGYDVLDVPVEFKSSEDGIVKTVLTDKYGGENHAGAHLSYNPKNAEKVIFTITANGIMKTLEAPGQEMSKEERARQDALQ